MDTTATAKLAPLSAPPQLNALQIAKETVPLPVYLMRRANYLSPKVQEARDRWERAKKLYSDRKNSKGGIVPQLQGELDVHKKAYEDILGEQQSFLELLTRLSRGTDPHAVMDELKGWDTQFKKQDSHTVLPTTEGSAQLLNPVMGDREAGIKIQRDDKGQESFTKAERGLGERFINASSLTGQAGSRFAEAATVPDKLAEIAKGAADVVVGTGITRPAAAVQKVMNVGTLQPLSYAGAASLEGLGAIDENPLVLPSAKSVMAPLGVPNTGGGFLLKDPDKHPVANVVSEFIDPTMLVGGAVKGVGALRGLRAGASVPTPITGARLGTDVAPGDMLKLAQSHTRGRIRKLAERVTPLSGYPETSLPIGGKKHVPSTKLEAEKLAGGRTRTHTEYLGKVADQANYIVRKAMGKEKPRIGAGGALQQEADHAAVQWATDPNNPTFQSLAEEMSTRRPNITAENVARPGTHFDKTVGPGGAVGNTLNKESTTAQFYADIIHDPWNKPSAAEDALKRTVAETMQGRAESKSFASGQDVQRSLADAWSAPLTGQATIKAAADKAARAKTGMGARELQAGRRAEKQSGVRNEAIRDGLQQIELRAQDLQDKIATRKDFAEKRALYDAEVSRAEADRGSRQVSATKGRVEANLTAGEGLRRKLESDLEELGLDLPQSPQEYTLSLPADGSFYQALAWQEKVTEDVRSAAKLHPDEDVAARAMAWADQSEHSLLGAAAHLMRSNHRNSEHAIRGILAADRAAGKSPQATRRDIAKQYGEQAIADLEAREQRLWDAWDKKAQKLVDPDDAVREAKAQAGTYSAEDAGVQLDAILKTVNADEKAGLLPATQAANIREVVKVMQVTPDMSLGDLNSLISDIRKVAPPFGKKATISASEDFLLRSLDKLRQLKNGLVDMHLREIHTNKLGVLDQAAYDKALTDYHVAERAAWEMANTRRNVVERYFENPVGSENRAWEQGELRTRLQTDLNQASVLGNDNYEGATRGIEGVNSLYMDQGGRVKDLPLNLFKAKRNGSYRMTSGADYKKGVSPSTTGTAGSTDISSQTFTKERVAEPRIAERNEALPEGQNFDPKTSTFWLRKVARALQAGETTVAQFPPAMQALKGAYSLFMNPMGRRFWPVGSQLSHEGTAASIHKFMTALNNKLYAGGVNRRGGDAGKFVPGLGPSLRHALEGGDPSLKRVIMRNAAAGAQNEYDQQRLSQDQGEVEISDEVLISAMETLSRTEQIGLLDGLSEVLSEFAVSGGSVARAGIALGGVLAGKGGIPDSFNPRTAYMPAAMKKDAQGNPLWVPPKPLDAAEQAVDSLAAAGADAVGAGATRASQAVAEKGEDFFSQMGGNVSKAADIVAEIEGGGQPNITRDSVTKAPTDTVAWGGLTRGLWARAREKFPDEPMFDRDWDSGEAGAWMEQHKTEAYAKLIELHMSEKGRLGLSLADLQKYNVDPRLIAALGRVSIMTVPGDDRKVLYQAVQSPEFLAWAKKNYPQDYTQWVSEGKSLSEWWQGTGGKAPGIIISAMQNSPNAEQAYTAFLDGYLSAFSSARGPKGTVYDSPQQISRLRGLLGVD